MIQKSVYVYTTQKDKETERQEDRERKQTHTVKIIQHLRTGLVGRHVHVLGDGGVRARGNLDANNAAVVGVRIIDWIELARDVIQ